MVNTTGFFNNWNFLHCLRGVDRNHVVIQSNKRGNFYFNHKNTHSVIFMFVKDARYQFLYVDVGYNGRISDRGVFRNCSLCNRPKRKEIKLPQSKSLSTRNVPVPYFFVADDAFAIKSNIMKPRPYHNQQSAKTEFLIIDYHVRDVLQKMYSELLPTDSGFFKNH